MATLIDITLLGSTLLFCLALCLLNIGWVGPRRDGMGHVAAVAAGGAPRQLGPYTLANKIGEGAMGEVYRAWHSALGRWRAVKVLPRHASALERERFEKEATVGAELRHPNTVAIYDRGAGGDGTPYFAMELIEGITLEQLIERDGPQSPERVLTILIQLCAALQAAHDQGLVHRDVKPSNVLLTGAGLEVVKLIDFGLVESVDAVGKGAAADVVIGTPLYISPEAIASPETVSARSDLYGLGAVAYYLLTGAPVFTGSSVIEVCGHHLHTAPAPLGDVLGGAGAELEAIVLACLAKDPAQRPASASELARRLSRCAERLADITDAAASNVGSGEAPRCLAAARAQRELARLEVALSDTSSSDAPEVGRIAA
jgi:eukaryotic-like serine/threonine-protein kinase